MIIGIILLLVAVVIWIGCVGFIRLRTPFDRLHCATFVAAAAGPLVVLLAFCADGSSSRAWKIVLLVVLLLVDGAALSHATSRTIDLRKATGKPS